jgi:hypothetical protein
MHIEFETHHITPEEAKGLVALLHALYGVDILPDVEDSYVGEPTLRASIPAETWRKAMEGTAPAPTAAAVFTPPEAASVVPVPEASAAAVFGTTPTPPAAAVFTPPASAVAATVDKRGIPWDERIHSSTKAVTAKGEWQRRRNTPDDLFDSVMGELKARTSGQTIVAATPLPTTVAPVPLPPVASVVTTTAPVPSPTPAAPVVSSTALAATADVEVPTFSKVMMTIIDLQTASKMGAKTLNNLLISVGAPTVAALNGEGAEEVSRRVNFWKLIHDPVNHSAE